MKKLTQLHDKFLKRSLKEKKIALDFLKAHLPSDVYRRIDKASLVLTDKSYVTPQLKEIHSDIVYHCRMMDDCEAYLYFLIEHESGIKEKQMPFRKLQYTVSLMDDHLKQGHEKLPLIISICIYHGKQKPYPYSTDIYDYFEQPELARAYAFKPFILVDLTVIPDEVIQQHGFAALMELLFKHAWQRDMLQVAKKLKELHLIQSVEKQLGQSYQEAVIKYIIYNQQNRDAGMIDQFIQELIEILPEEREVIMTVGEALEQRGLERGLERGLKCGKREKALEIAQKMLVSGMDHANVRRFTDLSDEVLADLID